MAKGKGSNIRNTHRVRVFVRVRPIKEQHPHQRCCVQVKPRALTLIKDKTSSQTFDFDDAFEGGASQQLVYDAVAKPVVQSVLEGFNGTIMAYGQTGTGKTYTLTALGDEDPSDRGIMLRSVQEIFGHTSPSSPTVEVSYFQLYLESVDDLLSPEKTGLRVHKDVNTGEVSVKNATVQKVDNVDQFIHLLRAGEANRHASRTNLNAKSSRSHAILVVSISVHDTEQNDVASGMPLERKSKLLIVDLAGSERHDKSGNEGHQAEEANSINLSLTCLGRFIDASSSVESRTYIPSRDSKLTRLLSDSFGGSARTSLLLTIHPSTQHISETSSTLLFGQRAMKVVNKPVKMDAKVDHERLCKDLFAEISQLRKDLDIRSRELGEIRCQLAEIEKKSVTGSDFRVPEHDELAFKDAEISRLKNELIALENTIRKKEDVIAGLKSELKQQSDLARKEKHEMQLQIIDLRKQVDDLKRDFVAPQNKTDAAERKNVELKKRKVPENEEHASSFGQQNSPSKTCEEVDLLNFLPLLKSKALDDQIQGMRVVANLAVEKSNHEKIVVSGGLESLLMLLKSSQCDEVKRLAVVAIANLSTNNLTHCLITNERERGVVRLLVRTAEITNDPETLRMAAAAISNLCGNGASLGILKEEGAIQALVGMTEKVDVIGYVARGLANFANCEYQAMLRGGKEERSLLIDDRVLTWLITNASTTWRDLEVALCFLAKNEKNAMEIVAKGGLTKVKRIAEESSEESIRKMAKEGLKLLYESSR